MSSDIQLPDPNENELLNLIRSGDYDKIVIGFKGKRMGSLSLVKEQDVRKKIVDLLRESPFQEILVKTHNGKITRIQSTVKLIFK